MLLPGTREFLGPTQEGMMSKKNGDKARFGRQHLRRNLLRKQMRELRKALMSKIPEPALAVAK